LVLFFIIDYKLFKKENLYPILKKLTKKKRESIRVYGLNNFLLLILIVLSVIFSGYVKLGELNVLSININFQDLIRDVAIVIIGIISLWTTKKEYRKENRFTFEPIKEVAILFGAIFITMIPALAILKAGANGHLGFLVGGIDKPIQYFWLSGLLSSILDNAPTYLTFLNMALGNFYSGTPEREAINLLIQNKGLFLEAISIGCVFMGANTYIGNAPNFMVKSIAEENGVKMPTFLGYIFKWSIPILMPLFFLLGVIFLRG
jgi:Na+/H+ antiporter NhaD/arsenite permease-like protein